MEMMIDETMEFLTDFSVYSPYQEAIDKVSAYIKQMQADYENRLKADMVAMFEELNLEIDEMFARRIDYTVDKIQDLIQQKINKLKGNEMAMTIEELKEFHDNTLDKEKWEVPKVRLFTQDEVEAMLTDLSMTIGEIEDGYVEFDEENKRSLTMIPLENVERLIDEKINALKENKDGKT